MAIFMDNGGGEIYGGPTREAVLSAIEADGDDYELSAAFEVPGSYQILLTDADEAETEELSTLDDEYTEGLGAYLMASTN